ncbi:MAG: class I SAM-dependent methyltransferase [bacterium]
MKQWYETLFENYATTYDKETFTQGTFGEVDFIEQEVGFNKSIRILDIGCGTGRHVIELARRGYTVTGIDLSESQLTKAREKAHEAGVQALFLQRDARSSSFNAEFDLVEIICEGGFALMETDEMNFAILRGASDALQEHGKLILTTLNALYPLYHSVKDFINQSTVTGTTSGDTFDVMTFRNHSTFTVTDDLGVTKELKCNERHYAPSEMTWLLRSLGFQQVEIFGCPLGAWNRATPLTTDDFEMLVVATR